MEATTITAFAENTSQIDAISAFIKSMNIKFTIAKTIKKDKPYNPEFVEKIRQSEDDFKNGRFTTVKKEDLKTFLGLE